MTDEHSEFAEIIAYIHHQIYGPLPLSKLAKLAGYSPYHFTRLFKEWTGLLLGKIPL